MNEEELVEEFGQYCCGCKRKMFVMCGTPVVHIGGCCSSIDGEKVKYIRTMKYHLHCYLEAAKKKSVKTTWKIKEVKRIIENEIDRCRKDRKEAD